jgi:O-antigen ligase
MLKIYNINRYKLGKFNINFPVVLLALIPYSFVIGPLVLEIVATCISIYFIFFIFKKKNFFILNNKFTYIFFLFYLYLVLRSFFSFDPMFSLKSSFFYFRFFFFIFGILVILNQFKSAEKIFLQNAFTSLILVFLGAVFEYLYFSELSPYYNINKTRLFSLFIDEPIPGSYMGRILPYAILSFFYFFKKIDYELNYRNILLIFLLLSVIISIYLTGERTGFFFSIFILFIIFLFIKIPIRLKLLSLIIFFLFFLMINILDKRSTRMITSSKEQIFGDHKNVSFIGDRWNKDKVSLEIQKEREFNANNFLGFSAEHKRHYYSAYLMFKDNIIFGQGPRAFRELCQKEAFYVPGACTTHPHNTVLQILSEIGLVGLFFYIVLLTWIFIFYIKIINKKFINNKKLSSNENFNILYYTALIIGFFPIITSGNFFNNWLSYFYYLPFAFIFKRSWKF